MLVSRRTFMQTGSMAVVGTAALTTRSCGQDFSFYSAIVIGTFKELRPLLPKLNDKIDRAIDIAEAVDKAYREGRFVNALTLYEDLAIAAREVTDAAGVDNQNVRLAIALGGVALRTVAAIIKARALANPEAAAQIQNGLSDSAKAMVQKMSDPRVLDLVFEAVKQ